MGRNSTGGGGGSRGGLSDAEQQAVISYQGGLNYPLNAQLRSGTGILGRGEVADLTRNLDLATGRHAVPSRVYRGVGPGTAAKLKVGGTLTDKGYSSTSVKRSVAAKFASKTPGGALIEIRVPKGQRGIKIADRSYSRDAEFLLPRGTSLRVTSVRRVKVGGRYVTVARARIVRRRR